MINPFKEVNWKPGLKEKREFARSLMIGFPALALIWLIVGKMTGGAWPFLPAAWLAGGGVAMGALLWTLPGIAKPFYVVWYGLACCIGLVVSNVLLVTFYVTVFTVFGIFRRAFGREAVQKGLNKSAASYWRNAEKVSDPKRYYSQF